MNATFNLTPSIIEKYNEKHLAEIDAIKDEENLKAMIGKSKTFWKAYENKIGYTEYLYLMKQFLIGNLYATLAYIRPIDNSHQESALVLGQLLDEGIITTGGQRSYEEETDDHRKQRSYLDFEMPIEESDIETAIQLLETLHEKGFNVSAMICEYDQSYDQTEYDEEMDYSVLLNPIRSIILFKSEDRTIHDLNAPTLNVKIPQDEYLVTVGGTWCPLDSPNYSDHLIQHVVYPAKYVISVSMFNQKWDMLQADEVLLETIRDMKQCTP